MAFFSNIKSGSPYLYLGQESAGDTGWCAYILPEDVSANSEIDLAQAFNDLPGSYLFSFTKPTRLGEDLVRIVWDYMAQIISPNRGILWVINRSEGENLQFVPLGFSRDPIRTDPTGKVFTITNALTGPLSDILTLQIPTNCEVSFDQNQAMIRMKGDTDSSGPIALNVIERVAFPEISPNQVNLFFSGDGRGCAIFDLYLRQGTDFNAFDFGLKYFIPDQRGGTGIQRYPILRRDEATQDTRVGFRVWTDLTNIENQGGILRTFFAFTARNKDRSPTLLPSAHTTVFGHAIDLTPQAQLGSLSELPGAGSALMVFQRNPRQGQDRYLAPSGNFALGFPDGSRRGEMLCGLNGTEAISCTAGDLLQFTPSRPAYAPAFPFPLASPVGPPIDPKAPLMTGAFTTSWVTVIKSSANSSDPAYMAQPKGSPLYGRDDLIGNKFPVLLGHKDPAFVLPRRSGFGFPCMPYSAVQVKDDGTTFTREQVESFELQVAGPTRRLLIGDEKPALVVSAARARMLQTLLGEPENISTPSGVIATIKPATKGATWSKILLGQIKGSALQQVSFDKPDPELIQAFQTSQLFLVATNSCHLGMLASGGLTAPCPSQDSEAVFHNQVEIGGWKLAAQVGQNNLYGQYRDVVIFKGRKGKLYDPPSSSNGEDPPEDKISLVANPYKWTQRGDFASPTTTTDADQTQLQPPDDSQQIILSQWLQDYFRDVRTRAADPKQKQYFQKLDDIAQDENWTGFLILKMTIEQPPDDLAGILAGITDMRAFNAHHFGIEIGQVSNEPGKPIALKNSSSMFGLIYYVDPNFVPPVTGETAQPVPPPQGQDYDFRLLMLSVLFENTAVKSFQSYAQVTLNRLFGMQVDHMGQGGNSFNTVVLRGTYQNNNGKPVYSLGNTSENTFYFDSNILQKVELTSALLSTLNAGQSSNDSTVVTQFGFTGFLDFKIIQTSQGDSTVETRDSEGDSPEAFDIFSFGNDEGQDLLRKGLSFSNLALLMSFPSKNPTERQFTFSAQKMSFDLATSTPRVGSLFSAFSLQIQGIQQGDAESPPSQAGYATVITDAKLNGVEGGDWWGFRYQLNMGTPGNLAGNLGLNSYLLTGWAPDSSGNNGYRAILGLQLPGTGGGAKLISLQNVLRLSIGQMRLTLDRGKPDQPIKPFLLMLTEIALKFLGLLKIPPSGSTRFYLFGNPQNQGKPSGLGWYAMYAQKIEQTVPNSLLPQEEERLMR